MGATDHSPQQRLRMIEELAALSGSRSAAFFEAHGLGASYAAPGKMSSKETRIVSALRQAERENKQHDVLRAAELFLARERGERETTEPLVERATTMAKPRAIFISHSSKDRGTANLLRDSLNLAGLGDDLIFYSSDRGTGVASGADVLASLRSALDDAALIIEILSEHYVGSTFCVMEYGAAWATQKPTFPVVLPPLERSQATSKLGNVHMHQLHSDCDIAEMLSDLHARVSSATGVTPSFSQWERASSHFTKGLAAV